MKKVLSLILLVTTISFAQTTAGEYDVENLTSNSKNSDFGTTFYGANKIIFSSARREKSILKSKWKENNQPFLDLYEGTISGGGTVTDVKVFSNNINTKFHESSVSFTPDQKIVYFTRDNYLNRKLAKDKKGVTNLAIYKASVASDGSWSDIQPMPFNNANYSTGHPTIDKTGKKLFFTSDMPGSLGKTDIYVVDILANGYGIPKNLGKKVNTFGKEMFPYIDSDNVLYYSSDAKEEGMGGLDVYAVKVYENNAVSKSLHLGKPVNSKYDDFAYIIKSSTHEGYFSSNRIENSKGDDDIYHFSSMPPLKIECDQEITGVVTDKKTGKPIRRAIVSFLNSDNKEIASVTTRKDGVFKFVADCESAYRIIASKEQYEKDEEQFTTKSNPDAKLTFSLELNPIVPEVVVETPVVTVPTTTVVRERVIVNINPIYFDFNKAKIRHDAKIELDKVVAIMNQHPSLMIEGGSHTDSRGSDSYNLSLSERRAKATVKYIISKGIESSRITARGYGETQLVNHCSNGISCEDFYHQQNRRTEFVILNPDVLGYY